MSLEKPKDPKTGRFQVKHGRSRTSEYRIWRGLRQRCSSPNGTESRYYGGDAGVTVCEEWDTSFDTFYADMGPRPGPEWSIDRIDGSKGYSPDNCRWATKKEQGENRKPTTRNSASTTGGMVGVVSRGEPGLGWVAQIVYRSVQIRLGTFATYDEAVQARLDANARVLALATDPTTIGLRDPKKLRELIRGGPGKPGNFREPVRITAEVRGETLLVKEITNLYGIPEKVVRERLSAGKTGEELIAQVRVRKKRLT